MRNLTCALIAVCVIVLPTGGYAATAKKIHRSPRPALEAQGSMQPRLNYFGNAAAEGNNANSMSGSNSPAENPLGRTSGGGFH